MRVPPRVRMAVVFFAGLAAGPVLFRALAIRASEPPSRGAPAAHDPRLSELLAVSAVQFGGFGGERPDAEGDTYKRPTVAYVNAPVSVRLAKTWEKLQAIVPMNYENETPLEDVLKAIREATKGPDNKRLQIYVDPIGLQEAEKTMTSTVTLALDDAPLTTSLPLLLKQLGLKYFVSPEGLVVITSGASAPDDVVSDPSAQILNELAALRREVADLRRELPARGVMGGSVGGSNFGPQRKPESGKP